ncbi:TadE/TadG family type IV pilus assembly protein [Streptomyces albidoflavus]|uniref:TadE/TadG family type IV pilus assembly protein n=1 Tax=Streptomyces TaxID=1883 RepID=UPI00063E8752|nr:TadE/TadG family type IV pilus assembly protein [Streptomyces sp. KE1]KLJ00189.1 septum determining protein [Streptomyces sp. KE1]
MTPPTPAARLAALVRDRRARLLGRPGASRPAADAGISTIEVVILAPVMILFILVLVAFGQLVDGRGALDGAARDAARAGSIQKDHGTALAEARRAAEANLADVCTGPVSVRQTSAGFEPDTLFTVEVSCQIRGLAMIGVNVPTTLTASFSSPLDPFRRTA